MQHAHHPVIRQVEDGRWVVTCPDCHRDRQSSFPIGIDLPVTSLLAAELMRDNHAGRLAANDGPLRPRPPEVQEPARVIQERRTRSPAPAVA